VNFKCSVHTTASPDAQGSEKDMPEHGTSSADKFCRDLSLSKACFFRKNFAIDNFCGKYANKMFPKLISAQGIKISICNIERSKM
jgi:hypothetical protein